MSLHTINIVVHISAGCIAILLGLIQLVRRKGDTTHKRLGRVTVTIAATSIAAALLGALVFRGKTDLIGVSFLTAYQLWSGVRALHLKHNGLGAPDLLPALALVAGGVAVYLLWRQGGVFNWGPARVYGAMGSLIFYGSYDVLRVVFPQQWRLPLNPAEHAFKLTSFIGALVSVAAAVLLPVQGVVVSLAASAVFFTFAIVFAVRAARYALGVTPSTALKARLNADREL